MERLWLIPSQTLESGQSQDEGPQTPGPSGQHWVLCVALIPGVDSSRCRSNAETVSVCANSHEEVFKEHQCLVHTRINRSPY